MCNHKLRINIMSCLRNSTVRGAIGQYIPHIHLSLLHNAYSASLYASLHLSLRCTAIRALQIYIKVYNLID